MKKIRTLDRKLRKKRRIGEKISGTEKKPRISVFRSNRYIYAQVVNDEKKVTLSSFSGLNLKSNLKEKKQSKRDQAKTVGLALAEKLKKSGIKEAVFDRAVYKYHGRVAAIAEGLREGGIKV